MKYKIGYIDEDPKQVKKYARILRRYNLDVIGYNIIQGLPIKDLISQIYESEVDLLMVDYLLVDKGILTYNGDEIQRKYEELMPNFPLIIFTSNETDAFSHVDNPHIIYEKELVEDPKTISRFVETLEKNIENYKNYKGVKKQKIQELLIKEEKVKLSAEEKETLFTNQFELDRLDNIKPPDIPKKLITNEKLDELSTARKEAEEFLKDLVKKKKDGAG